MATYLQGVTDYVPEFQPFQPDLNFYSNVLQTKQTQYDSNWQSLNKMYGQYFYADLTRDGNIKKKDELLKNMEFNLKRVSQLDLSLEQNVNQATQVFKPFYEDKNLMKDMSWTKTYNAQVGKAQALQGSAEEDRRKQFWDTGLRELQYRKDEFKKADDGTAMGFNNVAYTPYVNSVELAQKIAKDAGLSIESVDFSPDGKWIVTQKNGEKLKEPLSKLFEARLGSDPQVQAVYKTQAYVNRKDYAYSNAAQFDGDQNAAEMKYLENSFNILKDQNKQRYKAVQERDKSYESKIKSIEKDIADKKARPEAQKELDNLKAGKEINDKILERVEKENNELNKNSSSTPSTSTGFINPYGDVNSLRWKVDGGMASMLMSKDLNEAAEIFAYKDAKTSIKENPYKVLEIKHAQSMQQIHTRGSYSTRAASIRAKGATDAAKIKADSDIKAVTNAELLKRGIMEPKEVPVYNEDGTVKYGADGKPMTQFILAKTENEFMVENKFEVIDEINVGEQVSKDQNRLNGVFQTANAQLAVWLKKGLQSGALDEEEVDGILNPGDRFRGGKKNEYDKVLDRVLEGSDTRGPMGRPDDYSDFDPDGRSQRTKRVTIDNLGTLTKEDTYNLEKTFIPTGRNGKGYGIVDAKGNKVSAKNYKYEEGDKYVDNRNYYSGITENLNSFMIDNANLPYVRDTYQEVQSWLKPAEMAATVNHDFEDWKYNVKEAIIAEEPAAKFLFDDNNNLISKEQIRQIASKSVYGEKVLPESKKSFFEAVGDSFMTFATNGRNPMDVETLKYWTNFLGSDSAPSTWVGEKFTKYSPYVRGIAGLPTNSGDLKDQVYLKMKDKLNESYDKVFANMSDSKWLIQKDLSNIPGSVAIGEGGAGFAANPSVIQVLPQAPGSKGFAAWHGLVNDIRTIGNFDGKQSAILFGSLGTSGVTKTALDSDDAVPQTQKGRIILDALVSASLNPNTDLKPFTLKAQNIAAGDPNKGAMIIIPDAEWLKQFKSTNDKEDNNLLTTEQYNAALQGITLVSDSSNFNNSAMGSTYKTAMESIVDYRGYYEEVVPGAGKFRIEKGQKGTSDYIATTDYKIWKPEINDFEQRVVYDSFLPKGRSAQKYRDDAVSELYKIDQYNTQSYNGTFDLNY